ncbi:MBL fold metallo-hydrolase [Paenibacillus dendritiformis]|uniref:Beta-lactamase n=1 Tax=Paenibacillus dendritiformis C454 TaxID=1131935 RepID=H3SPR2_9BACL|nr:MBL fold metallo-hydrolase [Paenibacillus dendritiformis]EHQ58933.1 beta-lactamase [Paenibacillus dendritiformis C454]CAH8769794.1 MBL fold metallo-hydrolase [Paenibacillus dendritiformis]
MTLRIQMIGTGSAFAKKYFNNNALIYTKTGKLLVDCGITAPQALYHLGVSFDELDGVLISHIHGDHVGGLEEYAFQMKFRYHRKPKLFIAAPLVGPLWEHTLKGGLTQEGLTCLEDAFEVHPIEPGQTLKLLSGLKVKLLETPHIPGKRSFSFLFNDTFFYSADMQFQPDLLRWLVEKQGVMTIFHDCQLLGKAEVHAGLDDLLTLPDFIQERLWLMHYGDERDAFEGKTGRMRFVKQQEWMEIP